MKVKKSYLLQGYFLINLAQVNRESLILKRRYIVGKSTEDVVKKPNKKKQKLVHLFLSDKAEILGAETSAVYAKGIGIVFYNDAMVHGDWHDLSKICQRPDYAATVDKSELVNLIKNGVNQFISEKDLAGWSAKQIEEFVNEVNKLAPANRPRGIFCCATHNVNEGFDFLASNIIKKPPQTKVVRPAYVHDRRRGGEAAPI